MPVRPSPEIALQTPQLPDPSPGSILQRGFTLIEVMIAVAIVGILLTVALPSYRQYVLRGQLVDGTNLLAAGGANMERYFQDNRTYAAVGAITPPCSASSPAAARTLGSFTMTCTSDATTYALAAQGSGTTGAFRYTLDHQGNRATAITAGPSGWTGSTTCWVTKGGQSC